jgi:predicted PurR-regulated permease PerM
VQAPQPPPSIDHRELAQVFGMVRWLLIAVFVVLGWVILDYLTGVLGPILGALAIAYLLNPWQEALVRRGFGRASSAGILLGVVLGGFVVLLSVATPAIAHQLGDFVETLPLELEKLNVWLNEYGLEVPKDWRKYISGSDVKGALAASSPMQRFAELALTSIAGAIGVLAEILLVPVFAFYFMVDWPNLLRRLEHVIPPRRRAVVRDLVKEIDGVIANWVRGQATVTFILAVLYAGAFTVIRMPLSVPIGLIVGALTIIPFVGTFVGAALSLIVVITTGQSLSMLGSVAIVFVVLHLLEAGYLTPKIVGHRVGLSESGALLAVVAGGKLLGFVGVVLAVPIAATLAVLIRYAMRYYEQTSFFGHESDADIEITPGMAMIMPGIPWAPPVWEAGRTALDESTPIALEGDPVPPESSG